MLLRLLALVFLTFSFARPITAQPLCDPDATFTRVSITPDGGIPNASFFEDVDVSEDGLYVAFVNDASNLVPNDTDGTYDAFLYSRLTCQITRLSVNAAGESVGG